MDQKKSKKQIAERNYEAEDYQRKDELSKGLAKTHEQATDTLKEGYNDGSNN
ncbi:hypothetical protein J416_03006 [Gracilibacillus halophilus YIM-C55.5]|uniref:DUF4025 domain-containing protein n=1 Tax=Gracilibacillus halophilus YIM-C55.5 TaxID=1308866 RepID=N4WC77_9BACI|nr:YozQ family protein [Gracilibacillus halophilus]ENH97888.1 hypothetical protein J416_03006 [Gracilibacillus halophilus YIM-C55.5]